MVAEAMERAKVEIGDRLQVVVFVCPPFGKAASESLHSGPMLFEDTELHVFAETRAPRAVEAVRCLLNRQSEFSAIVLGPRSDEPHWLGDVLNRLENGLQLRDRPSARLGVRLDLGLNTPDEKARLLKPRAERSLCIWTQLLTQCSKRVLGRCEHVLLLVGEPQEIVTDDLVEVSEAHHELARLPDRDKTAH